jgi:hypothetical protein
MMTTTSTTTTTAATYCKQCMHCIAWAKHRVVAISLQKQKGKWSGNKSKHTVTALVVVIACEASMCIWTQE